MENCEKALNLEPNNIKALIRKARIEASIKKNHKAIETYEKIL